MRRFDSLVVALAITLCSSALAMAQSWPQRQITFIVPFPAGALSDAAARILQPHISEALGQPVVVENRAGAGGVIGATAVTRAQPDGYTLLISVNGPIVMAPSIQKTYPFDPRTALAGVSMISETYLALAVRSDLPIRSVNDVIRLAKERPMNFGSSGVGSAHQIAGALLSAKGGVSLSHVPFQGGAPAIQALAGGHIDMTFGSLPLLVPMVKSGQFRLIALAEPKRYSGMPDLPTINETLPGVETTSWVGMFAPAGTPKDIIEKLSKVVAAALDNKDVRDKMVALGMVPMVQGPAEFERTIAESLKFWSAAIELAKIEKQ